VLQRIRGVFRLLCPLQVLMLLQVLRLWVPSAGVHVAGGCRPSSAVLLLYSGSSSHALQPGANIAAVLALWQHTQVCPVPALRECGEITSQMGPVTACKNVTSCCRGVKALLEEDAGTSRCRWVLFLLVRMSQGGVKSLLGDNVVTTIAGGYCHCLGECESTSQECAVTALASGLFCHRCVMSHLDQLLHHIT
jgi:hypothetical protein